MPLLDNPQQELFCQYVTEGNTLKDAYVSAGYKTTSARNAESAASRLAMQPHIKARIVELMSHSAKLATVDRAWVVQRLMRNAMIAMGEVSAMTVKELNKETGEKVDREIYDRDGSVANKALELLGKMPELSMFVERQEVGAPGDFARMTEEELKKELFEAVKSLSAADLKLTKEHKTRSAPGSKAVN